MNHNHGSRVVMVTGATSGICRAVANRFASASDRVIAIGRNATVLASAAAEIGEPGGHAKTVALDITQENELQRIFDDTISEFGRLDVLVNAAGHISTGSIENTSLAAWDSMMSVNL